MKKQKKPGLLGRIFPAKPIGISPEDLSQLRELTDKLRRMPRCKCECEHECQQPVTKHVANEISRILARYE